MNDYPKQCFENLPDEFEHLKKKGRTGVEAFTMANGFENRLKSRIQCKHGKLYSWEIIGEVCNECFKY